MTMKGTATVLVMFGTGAFLGRQRPDAQEVRTTRLVIVDEKGQPQISISGGPERPEIRFHATEDGQDIRIRPDGSNRLEIRIPKAPPIFVGTSMSKEGRDVVGIHVGSPERASFGIGQSGAAFLAMESPNGTNAIVLEATSRGAQLGVGELRKRANEQVVERGVVLWGSGDSPSITLLGKGGSEGCRVGLAPDGGGLVNVANPDRSAYATLQGEKNSVWCGTVARFPDGRMREVASVRYDTVKEAARVLVASPASKSPSGFQGARLLAHDGSSSLELQDEHGRIRVRAASEQSGESIVTLDEKEVMSAGVLVNPSRRALFAGYPGAMSALVACWVDQLLWKATDEAGMDRVVYEIGKDGKEKLEVRDERGKLVKEGFK